MSNEMRKHLKKKHAHRRLIYSLTLVSVISIGIILLLTNIKPDINESQISDGDYIELTFEEAVSHSTHILDAIYVGEHVSEYGNEYMFKPVKMLKGKINTNEDDIIYVQSTDLEGVTYLENEEYLLLLEKSTSIYYEHNKYMQLSNLHISSTDQQWAQYHDQIQRILADIGDSAPPTSDGVETTTSTNIEEILQVTKNIFIVKVQEVYAESTVNPTTVYKTKVTKTIKNTPDNDGIILITFFNDTVEVGNEYLVLLADETETAPVYTLSSKASVYSLEEAMGVPELESLLRDVGEYEGD